MHHMGIHKVYLFLLVVARLPIALRSDASFGLCVLVRMAFK